MNKKIYELELNFSNVCGAECIICSRPHGCGNKFFMDWDVFNVLVKQLKDVEFKMIQTSGNGETFLNPNYLDYIKILKDTFPTAVMWTYNNFSMMTKERTHRIVEENLFDRIHVRIESLEKWIFERNGNLNQENVFDNLKYFLSQNKNIPVVILYNDIRKYYVKCQNVLGKRPVRDFYTDDELSKIKDERESILSYFQKGNNSPLSISVINHSLWGERLHAPKDEKTPCPKLDIINNVTWICPDGKVQACCYSDRQDEFTCGDIMQEHILDIYNGEKRKSILQKIANREFTEYPCTNPKCCGFHEGRENTSKRHQK